MSKVNNECESVMRGAAFNSTHATYYRRQHDWQVADQCRHYNYWPGARPSRFSQLGARRDLAVAGYYRPCLDPDYRHSLLAPFKCRLPNYWDRSMDYTSVYFPVYTGRLSDRFSYWFN